MSVALVPRLTERILERTARIAILGQGYVGLTLACEAAAEGFDVLGVDTDAERIERLRRGEPAVAGVDEALLREGVGSGRLAFTIDAAAAAGSEVLVIAVPTPLLDHHPDLSFVEAACDDLAPHVKGALVVLESTTYPGTTDELVRTRLEAATDLREGRDFLLAYSAERIDPGNAAYGLRNTPKVVSGVSPGATQVALAFYEQLVDKVVAVSSTRVAETSKLFENTFRHVNIALVNELAMLCRELGIDIWEVVDAAATKPFGFMPFYPGPGIGGHCIPLDPTYLAWKIREESGRRFGLLELAQEVNERMPEYVASRALEILNGEGRALKGARVLVLGVTYKADVGDARESPALPTMRALARLGAEVHFHDPFVERVRVNGAELERDDLGHGLERSDLVVLLTPHASYDLRLLAEQASLIFDTRNAYGATRPANVVPL